MNASSVVAPQGYRIYFGDMEWPQVTLNGCNSYLWHFARTTVRFSPHRARPKRPSFSNEVKNLPRLRVRLHQKRASRVMQFLHFVRGWRKLAARRTR